MICVSSKRGLKSYHDRVFYYPDNYLRNNYQIANVRKRWNVERKFQLTVLLPRTVPQLKPGEVKLLHSYRSTQCGQGPVEQKTALLLDRRQLSWHPLTKREVNNHIKHQLHVKCIIT